MVRRFVDAAIDLSSAPLLDCVMSEPKTIQELEGLMCESPPVAGGEGRGVLWIDNAVTESHDADDGASHGKSVSGSLGDSTSRRQESGGAIASGVKTSSISSPTHDAPTLLGLQAIDREAAAQVFRTARATSNQGKSSKEHGELIDRASGSHKPPQEQEGGADQFLQEFASVVQRLTSGVRLDADDGPANFTGFVANRVHDGTTILAEPAPTQLRLQVHGGKSDPKPKASQSIPVPQVTLKDPPDPATVALGKPTGKRKRPTGGTSAGAGKKKATASRKAIDPSADSIAPSASPKASEAPSDDRLTTGPGPSVHNPSPNASKATKRGGSKGTKPTSIVGPRSIQMQVVIRMANYMTQTFTDTKLVRNVIDAIMKCTEEHQKGVRGFEHLPGAILDHLLDLLDPNEFIRIFNICKFSMPDLPAEATGGTELMLPDFYVQNPTSTKGTDDETKPVNHDAGPNRTEAEPASEAKLDSTPDVLATTPVNPFSAMADREYIPDLLEAAVGYGFHLASLYPHSMDGDFHTFLIQGASTVLEMNLTDRRLLWKYLLSREHSRMPPVHLQHLSGYQPTYEGTLLSSPQVTSQPRESAVVTGQSPGEKDASPASEDGKIHAV